MRRKRQCKVEREREKGRVQDMKRREEKKREEGVKSSGALSEWSEWSALSECSEWSEWSEVTGSLGGSS